MSRPNILFLLGTGSDMAEVWRRLECQIRQILDVLRVWPADRTLAET
jgi:hypothetical protein